MVAIVYLVAGMSSRFNGRVKQMAIIGPNDETLIEYSVNQALTCPYSKLIFVTNSSTEYLFKNIFGSNYKNIPVEYVEQKYDKNKRERPWGTTDAVCSIINNINEPFIMVNSDDIYGINTFKKGFNLLNNSNKNIIGGIKMDKILSKDSEANRGVIYLNNNNVINIKEMLKISREKNPELLSTFASVNFIGLQPKALEHLNKLLLQFKELNKNDPKIECLLPDYLGLLIQEQKIEIQFFEIIDEILGITYPEDEIIIKKKIEILI